MNDLNLLEPLWLLVTDAPDYRSPACFANPDDSTKDIGPLVFGSETEAKKYIDLISTRYRPLQRTLSELLFSASDAGWTHMWTTNGKRYTSINLFQISDAIATTLHLESGRDRRDR